MTVGELIAELDKWPRESEVMVPINPMWIEQLEAVISHPSVDAVVLYGHTIDPKAGQCPP